MASASANGPREPIQWVLDTHIVDAAFSDAHSLGSHVHSQQASVDRASVGCKACTGPDAMRDPGPGRDSRWSSRKTNTREEGSEVTTKKPSELKSRAETVRTVKVGAEKRDLWGKHHRGDAPGVEPGREEGWRDRR